MSANAIIDFHSRRLAVKFTKRHSRFVLVFCFVVLASLFVTCGHVWAAWGARVVHYSQTDIIPIRAKIRFLTLIVLPANGEKS